MRVVGKDEAAWFSPFSLLIKKTGGDSDAELHPKVRQRKRFLSSSVFLQHFYIVFTKWDICREQLINATFPRRFYRAANQRRATFRPRFQNNQWETGKLSPGSRNSQSETTCGSHLGNGNLAAWSCEPTRFVENHTSCAVILYAIWIQVGKKTFR